MKRAIVSVGLLLLSCSAALAAATPRPPDLQAFLTHLRNGPTPIQAASKKGDGPGGVTANAYCEANCGSYSINCSGGSCSAADRNCDTGQSGFVQCDGGPPTYCSPGCNCANGWQDWRDGGCCQGGWQKWQIYECVDGGWQHIDTYCDSVSCF
jgi:hypothetical protein